MTPQHPDWIWLDARETVTAAELTRVCGLNAGELDELVDYGALTPEQSGCTDRLFSAAYVTHLRTASKLRLDFDLDIFTVAIVLDYLGRIDALERHVRVLEDQRAR